MTLEITQPLAIGRQADENDVRLVKIALNKLGYYTPDFQQGMSGEVDDYFFDAIRNFQRASMILANGQINPDDATIRHLNEELEDPNNFALFKGNYIWRTVGDEKVRGIHRIRDGRQYSWNDPPEGGHPGEDFGCRCWAEPIIPMIPKGLNVGLPDLLSTAELDAIKSSISPLDLIGFIGKINGKIAFRLLENTSKKKLGSLEKSLRNYLEKDFRTITNKSGDKIFLSKDQKRRVRFDIKNSQDDKPHAHIEKKTPSGKWKDATKKHRIRFKE